MRNVVKFSQCNIQVE